MRLGSTRFFARSFILFLFLVYFFSSAIAQDASKLNVDVVPLTCGELLGGKDPLTSVYDSLVNFGLMEGYSHVVYGVGLRPKYLYRGERGPLAFFPEELLSKDVEVLNKKLRRIRENLSEYYDLGEKIPHAREMRPLRYLLAYLVDEVIGKTFRGKNFNIYPKQAESWAMNKNHYGAGISSATGEAAWAERFLNELKNMAFILKTKTPPGQKLWPDMSGDESFGIMTNLSPVQFNSTQSRESVFRIAYKGNWHRPTDKVMETWWTYSDFIQKTVKMVLESRENEPVESMLQQMQAFRKSSNLPFQ